MGWVTSTFRQCFPCLCTHLPRAKRRPIDHGPHQENSSGAHQANLRPEEVMEHLQDLKTLLKALLERGNKMDE